MAKLKKKDYSLKHLKALVVLLVVSVWWPLQHINFLRTYKLIRNYEFNKINEILIVEPDKLVLLKENYHLSL